MKIRITHLHEYQNAVHVKFHSLFGNGIAQWEGTTPNIGEHLDVELDMDEIFSLQRNIKSSSDKTPSISTLDGVTRITAEIIGGTDGELTALYLGNSIILIELDKPLPNKSGFVEVSTKKIRLYPTAI
ncbi:hypothetical protein BFW86_12140 [Pseudomonas fluorescens]|nr:hypothetical protein BFW86_12140 [Pseudomonas fluorescens]